MSARRLAAIMVADIAGYSRMMGADERGTHTRVMQIFRELVYPSVAEHRGRIVKQRGDGFLATFDSTVESVRCAIVIQQSMVGRNLELRQDDQIRFRIGINLGEVIVEPEDVYGDGVNVAARLEQLAEPGYIYVSGSVYEQVRYKLVCGYQSLGDKRVKNIQDPVPIYRVMPDPAAIVRAARRSILHYAIPLAALVMAFGIGGIWFGASRTGQPTAVVRADPPTASPAPASSAAPPVAAPPPAPPIVHAVIEQPAPPPPQPAPEPPATQPTVEAMGTVPKPPPRIVPTGPEMVLINGGSFMMGSNEDPSERPVHRVAVRAFLIGKYPVTVGQWRACVAANACLDVVGYDDAPASNISWDEAVRYVAWLASATGKPFRLPSEAEWEFAARGGTDTRYWWGNAMFPGLAVCRGCGGEPSHPQHVGTRPANPYGLYDLNGGITEWVADCWAKDYVGAPTDGSARETPGCRDRVLRGAAWTNDPSYVRSANRNSYNAAVRYPTHGLRVAASP